MTPFGSELFSLARWQPTCPYSQAVIADTSFSSAVVHLPTLISSTHVGLELPSAAMKNLLLGLQTSCRNGKVLLNQSQIDPDARHCQHARNLGIPSDLTGNVSVVEHELLSSMAIASARGRAAVEWTITIGSERVDVCRREVRIHKNWKRLLAEVGLATRRAYQFFRALWSTSRR